MVQAQPQVALSAAAGDPHTELHSYSPPTRTRVYKYNKLLAVNRHIIECRCTRSMHVQL